MQFALDTIPDLARRDPRRVAPAELGMSPAAAAIFRDTLSGPGGLLLIAGTEASGRTTTLEAGQALRGGTGVATIDEIDDAGAADGAIRAALAGDFVIATIRAEGAVAAITRLKVMRADPFLIASALRAVFGQRLMRRLCRACREPVQASRDVSARLGFDLGTIVYTPTGCAACDGTGYRGRIGLFEAIRVDPAMRRLIDCGDEAIIAGQAFRDGPDLGGAARLTVREGNVSAEDALIMSRSAAWSG